MDLDNNSNEEAANSQNHMGAYSTAQNINTDQSLLNDDSLNGQTIETTESENYSNTDQLEENNGWYESHSSDLNNQQENESDSYEGSEDEVDNFDQSEQEYTANEEYVYAPHYTNNPADAYHQQNTALSANHNSSTYMQLNNPSRPQPFDTNDEVIPFPERAAFPQRLVINNTQNPAVNISHILEERNRSLSSSNRSMFGTTGTGSSFNNSPLDAIPFTASSNSLPYSNVNRSSLPMPAVTSHQSSIFQSSNLSDRTTLSERQQNTITRPLQRVSPFLIGSNSSTSAVNGLREDINSPSSAQGVVNAEIQSSVSHLNTTSTSPNSGFGFSSPQQGTTNLTRTPFGGFGTFTTQQRTNVGFGFGLPPPQQGSGFGQPSTARFGISPLNQTSNSSQSHPPSFGSTTPPQTPNSGLFSALNHTPGGNGIGFGVNVPSANHQHRFGGLNSLFVPSTLPEPTPQPNLFSSDPPSIFNNTDNFAPVSVNDIPPQHQVIRRRNRAVFRSNFSELLRSIRRARMSSAELRGVRDDRKLFIGGLHPSITENDLRQYFQRFGIIESIKLHVDRKTRESRRFAFVVFYSPTIVEAIMSTNNHAIGNHTLYIEKPGHPKPRSKDVKQCAIM